jgi:hypothetical protein
MQPVPPGQTIRNRITRPLLVERQDTSEVTAGSDNIRACGDRKLNRLAVVESQPEDVTSEPTDHCRSKTSAPISTTDDIPPQGSDPVLPEATQSCR